MKEFLKYDWWKSRGAVYVGQAIIDGEVSPVIIYFFDANYQEIGYVTPISKFNSSPHLFEPKRVWSDYSMHLMKFSPIPTGDFITFYIPEKYYY